MSLVGRVPRFLITAAGNQYVDGELTVRLREGTYSKTPYSKIPLAPRHVYKGNQRSVTGRYILTHAITKIPSMYTLHPFTAVFWLRLRMWIRRARRTVINRALVRHHLPSLLGKRKVR